MERDTICRVYSMPRLFVGDGCAGRSSEMDDFESFEADFTAPIAKVRAGIIKGIAKLDEHVQRHQQAEDILAPRVVNERFNGDEGAAGRQGVVGCANEV